MGQLLVTLIVLPIVERGHLHCRSNEFGIETAPKQSAGANLPL